MWVIFFGQGQALPLFFRQLASSARFFVFCGLLLSFASLPHTFGEQIFDLPVDGAEIILRPCGDLLPERGGKAQQELLFFFVFFVRVFFHGIRPINRSIRCSRRAVRLCCRRGPPADWRPWRPCVLRPVQRSPARSAWREPSPPCRQRRPRSSSWRR